MKRGLKLNYFFWLLMICLVTIIGCTKKQPEIQIKRQLTYPENLPDRLELDAEHRAVHDSEKWGQGATKPWNERYRIDDSKSPYLGGVGNSKNN